MRVRVLGSAAGGGFPQWNCNCPQCRAARDGSPAAAPRTQSSIAVSADDRHWFLFNASPDIRLQILQMPSLWPRGDGRHTPIQGVVLSDAELDHTLGLLSLRESGRVQLHCTAWTRAALETGSGLLRTLEAYCAVDWRPVRLHQPMPLRLAGGNESGLRCEAFPTFGAKRLAFGSIPPNAEAVVGFRINDRLSDRTLVYLPAVQELSEAVVAAIRGCSCLLLDGTCWRNDELIRLGVGRKTARDMGHLPIGGEDGSLRRLADLDIGRAIYIHLNNTNPALIEGSPEWSAIVAQRAEVAFDGMELEV